MRQIEHPRLLRQTGVEVIRAFCRQRRSGPEVLTGELGAVAGRTVRADTGESTTH